MLCPANELGGALPLENADRSIAERFVRASLHCRNSQVYNLRARMRGEVFLPRRRSVRLSAFDYSRSASYFLTICTDGKRRNLGELRGHTVALSAAGQIVEQCWREIPAHFIGIELGPQVVMPNHVHGIIRLLPNQVNREIGAKHSRRAQHAVPLRPEVEDTRRFGSMVANSIPAIVRSFKSAAAMRIRALVGKPRLVVWQRGYFEHIIRNEDDFHNTCAYIRTNPARWEFDENHS
jgi:putative transposase